jgi:hypothetical protein
MFVFLSLYGISHAITEEEAAQQWDAVKGTVDESTFLMNLFLKERIPGSLPEAVKSRFYEIATPEDATVLLKIWVNSNKKQRPFALTLLEGLNGDEFTELFEEYLYLTSDLKIQYRLYNLMAQHNSLSAFRAAVKLINYTQEQGEHRQAIFYLHAMTRFKNSDIRQEIINGTMSPSNITRAASYKALRNYPDDEVMEIIENALSSDTGIIPGEENRVIPERHIKSGKAGKTLIENILKGSKKYIEQERKFNKITQKKQR